MAETTNRVSTPMPSRRVVSSSRGCSFRARVAGSAGAVAVATPAHPLPGPVPAGSRLMPRRGGPGRLAGGGSVTWVILPRRRPRTGPAPGCRLKGRARLDRDLMLHTGTACDDISVRMPTVLASAARGRPGPRHARLPARTCLFSPVLREYDHPSRPEFRLPGEDGVSSSPGEQAPSGAGGATARARPRRNLVQPPDRGESGSALDRRQFLRGLAATGAIAGTGNLLAACSSGSSSSAPAAAASRARHGGGSLKVGLTGGSGSDTLDPHKGLTYLDTARAQSLYQPLLQLNTQAQSEFVLAEEISPHGSTSQWVIRLRPGITFHDGKPLTAEDVIFTFTRIIGNKLTG